MRVFACSDAFMDFTSGILSVTGINATGHIFASYPGRHLTVLGGFVDQVSVDQGSTAVTQTNAHRSAQSFYPKTHDLTRFCPQ